MFWNIVETILIGLGEVGIVVLWAFVTIFLVTKKNIYLQIFGWFIFLAFIGLDMMFFTFKG